MYEPPFEAQIAWKKYVLVSLVDSAGFFTKTCSNPTCTPGYSWIRSALHVVLTQKGSLEWTCTWMVQAGKASFDLTIG